MSFFQFMISDISSNEWVVIFHPAFREVGAYLPGKTLGFVTVGPLTLRISDASWFFIGMKLEFN